MSKKRDIPSDDNKEFIFKLKPVNDSNRVKYKGLGYISKGDQIKNDLYDLPDNYIYPNQNITIKSYGQNLPLGYVLSNDRVPIMYIAIYLSKKFLTAHLFNITLYAKLTTDLKTIKNIAALLGTQLDSEFYIQIDHKSMSDKHYPIEQFTTYQKMTKELLKVFEQDEVQQLVQTEISEAENKAVQQYGNNIAHTIPKETIDIKKILAEDF